MKAIGNTSLSFPSVFTMKNYAYPLIF